MVHSSNEAAHLGAHSWPKLLQLGRGPGSKSCPAAQPFSELTVKVDGRA